MPKYLVSFFIFAVLITPHLAWGDSDFYKIKAAVEEHFVRVHDELIYWLIAMNKKSVEGTAAITFAREQEQSYEKEEIMITEALPVAAVSSKDGTALVPARFEISSPAADELPIMMEKDLSTAENPQLQNTLLEIKHALDEIEKLVNELEAQQSQST